MGSPRDLFGFFRQYPFWATMDMVSLILGLLLLPMTFVLITRGVTTSTQIFWQLVIGIGIGITILWNIVYPVYKYVLLDGR